VIKRKRPAIICAVAAWLIGFVMLVAPTWQQVKEVPSPLPFSPFVAVSDAEFQKIRTTAGFADCIGTSVGPIDARVATIGAKSLNEKGVSSFRVEVDAKPKPFVIEVANAAGWVGPPQVRGITDGQVIGLIFNGCGHGLVNKHDSKGALLLSMSMAGHAHSTGVYVPRKRLLCVGNENPASSKEPDHYSAIHVLDWDTGQEVALLKLPAGATHLSSMAISQDERFLFVGSKSRNVDWYRLALP
jgi:hypothetical protein